MAKITAFFLAFQMFFCALFGAGGLNGGARKIAKDEYAAAAFSLERLVQNKCYNSVKHTLQNKTDAAGAPYVWPAASFVEMLADAYRLFPGDVRLKTNYRDALKNYLPTYLAKDQTLQTPSGEVAGISYYNASQRSAGDYYYDDNEWVCIQLLIGYRNLKDKSLLAAAEQNLAFLWTGWDDVVGGGLYWSASYTSKNACANAPAAIAFLLAYQLTGNELYLTRGKMIYDWMNLTLRENDLFADAAALDGRIDGWKGAYNQATMIYAGSLLYEITGDERYYELTKATVDATVPHMFTRSVNEAGETVITMNANPIFKAWCVDWLVRAYVRFYEVDPQKDPVPMQNVTAVMRAELGTKTADGLYDPFFCSGASDPDNATELLAQCGVACALLNTAYYNAVLHE